MKAIVGFSIGCFFIGELTDLKNVFSQKIHNLKNRMEQSYKDENLYFDKPKLA